MKKSIFRHNKRILATLCSAAILFGSFACLGSSTVSAVTETPAEELKSGVLSKVTYDFTSEFNYTSYKSSSNGSILAVPADETNNCFAITGGSYQSYALCLPYTIDNNSKYRISYDIKAESGTTIVNNYETTGIRVTYAADGKNVQNNQEMNANGLTSASLHKYLWGTKKEAAEYPTEWTKQSIEISTGESEIIGDRNTLAFFVRFNKADGKIYLDNIVVEKLDPNVAAYDFEEDVNVNWKFSGYNANDLVSLETETVNEKENHYLKLTKIGNWADGYIVFPFELENGATYKVSYDYKVDKAFTGRVGLTASAATNGVLGSASSGHGNTPSVVSTFYYDTKWVKFNVTPWTPVTNTITVGASDINDTIKYLAMYYSTTTSGAYDTMYIDNLVIEKVVNLSFGEDAAAITGKPGSEVNLPTPTAKFGYTFNGWYDSEGEAANLIGNAGATIICPAKDTTYYAKWVKNTSCNVNFEDGSYAPILSTGANTPKVADDPDGSGNKVLETNGAGEGKESSYKFVLPVELEADTYYTVSFRYKAELAEGKSYIQLDVTQGTEGNPSYVGSYVSLANSNGEIQQRLMRLLDGGSVDEIGKWNENQVSNTDWKTCTYKIHATENGNYAMLNWIFYWGVPTDCAIYFDDISIQKTPNATFNTGDGATKIDPITENPGTVIKPGCPTREGYRFMGWYVDGKYAGFNTVVMPNENTEFTAVWKLQADMGDVNMDETVDDNDFVMLKKILLGINVGDYDAAAANCHDDGGELILDILDLVTLKNALAAPQ